MHFSVNKWQSLLSSFLVIHISLVYFKLIFLLVSLLFCFARACVALIVALDSHAFLIWTVFKRGGTPSFENEAFEVASQLPR